MSKVKIIQTGGLTNFIALDIANKQVQLGFAPIEELPQARLRLQHMRKVLAAYEEALTILTLETTTESNAKEKNNHAAR